MAAAIGGVERGTQRGKEIAEQRRRDESRLRQRAEQMEKEALQQIADKFDKDGSGLFDKGETKQMLLAYNAAKDVEAHPPTDNDIDFLFRLCDRKGSSDRKSDGTLDKDELMELIKAWAEWLKQADKVKACLASNDANADGSIDKNELAGVLSEVGAGRYEEIPTEVVDWCMTCSDLNDNGTLQQMELARALCAFEFWCAGQVPYPPPPLAKYMKNAKQELKVLPPAQRTSQCCVIN